MGSEVLDYNCTTRATYPQLPHASTPCVLTNTPHPGRQAAIPTA